MTIHMQRNDAAAPGHVCPGIFIHAIDIVQSPGIGIPPIADIDAHHTIVIAALAAKMSAKTPRNRMLGSSPEGALSCDLPIRISATVGTTLSPARTRRAAATRRPARFVPWVRDRA